MEKLEEAAASGDEDFATQVSNFSRAVLIALAAYDADAEIDLQGLTIKTSTACRILGMSQEYVRELVRGKVLDAAKKNGEFQIPLSSVVSLSGQVGRASRRSRGPRGGRDTQGQDTACLRLPVRPPAARTAGVDGVRPGHPSTLPRNTWVSMSVSMTDSGVPVCTTRPMSST